MSVDIPALLALDFDGVLCDGMEEYFQSTWQTYQQIWPAAEPAPREPLKSSFVRLRPVIETGWEMPVLLRALILGGEENSILQNWPEMAREIVREENVDPRNIASQLDTVRDRAIHKDLEGWLGLHRFYDGAIAQLQKIQAASTTQLYIITTKEGRFARKLLQQQGVELPPSSVIGKEAKRPKHETLRDLIAAAALDPHRVWFVEDRLKTLRNLQQQSDLQAIRLYLAAWGYNTPQIRDSVRRDPHIRLLSLQQFGRDLAGWI